jgi:cobalt-zinc-cadmium efflux system membrane fusion protein
MKTAVLIKNSLNFFVFFMVASIGLTTTAFSHESAHSEGSEEAEDFIRGPHGGRLLENDGLGVEVTIYEPEGVPPKFRIYFYDNEKPVNPSDVNYEMELKRINRDEKIPFKQVNDYLESTVEASEPHSFKVDIKAIYKNNPYKFDYESFEARVEINQETLQGNNIQIEKAGPINLEIQLNVMGKIMPNQESTVYMAPRYPGVVKAVNKRLGDYVKKGEVLAVIESNESLQNYEVKSEIDGLVLKKEINIGMYLSGQENIFVISDLSTVWADFNIYRQDLGKVKLNDPIKITTLDGNVKAKSKISYISPVGYESTQSVVARAILKNKDQKWRPGLFVSGLITVENTHIPVAVRNEALQTYRGWNVVFLKSGDIFEAVPVVLGKRNKNFVEIKTGLKANDEYVSKNSYIIKADLEKSGASHDH